MNYSCHGTYKDIHLVFSLLYCTVPRIKGGQGQNNQTFGALLVSVKTIEKVTSTQEQVQEYCNWRKFRL